jgi:DNA repair exonuclease SbcCD ATPase subunit
MQEGERRAQTIKLTHQLAKLIEDLKLIERDRSDIAEQMCIAEKELPDLERKKTLLKQELEQKKKELEHGQTGFHTGFSIPDRVHSMHPQKEMHLDRFGLMSKKASLDREYTQKEHEIERKQIELKAKVVGLKQKHNIFERQFIETTNTKHHVERELADIKHEEELAKRIGRQNVKKITPKSFLGDE